MPILLAFDTSASACSVGLLIEGKKHMLHEAAPMQHAQKILPMIDSLLKEHHCTLNQLNGIVFGKGPGSFTGVRITASTAQALSFAHQLPLIAVSSLAAAAQSIFEEKNWRNILVAMDARMQEVYWGAYTADARGLVQLVGQEQVSSPVKVTLPEGVEWSGAGDGWRVYADTLPIKLAGIDADRVATASALLSLGLDLYEKKSWLAPEEGIPTYLRNQVAFPGK